MIVHSLTPLPKIILIRVLFLTNPRPTNKKHQRRRCIMKVINCIYFQTGLCKSKKVKKSLLQFWGTTTCKKLENKLCDHCVHMPKPIDRKIEEEEESLKSILKELVNSVETLNLKYSGSKENNVLNVLSKARSFLKE